MLTTNVIERTPTSSMESMEENLLGHVAFLQERLPGMTVEHRDGLVIVDSGLATDTFNKILHARLDGDDVDPRIESAVTYFETRRRPFSWWVGPCSRPLDLERRLRRRGLRGEEYELGMTVELTTLPVLEPAPGTRIERVRSPEMLRDFAGVLARLHDPPEPSVTEFFDRGAAILLEDDVPMRFFVAYVGVEPAAVSELFLGGGVAGVHMVATDARFRRRRLGMAVTRTALEEGKRAGMATGALQASPEGESVYLRLGFQPCGRFVEYVPS